MTNLEAIFLHGFHHAWTNKWKAYLSFFFFLVRRICDRYNDPKKYESDDNFSEPPPTFQAVFPFVRACGLNTRLKFRSKFAKVSGASQKECQFTLLLDFNVEPFCCCISWWVMTWVMQLASIDRLRVSSANQFSPPWSGTTIFGAVTNLASESR